MDLVGDLGNADDDASRDKCWNGLVAFADSRAGAPAAPDRVACMFLHLTRLQFRTGQQAFVEKFRARQGTRD